MGPESAHQEQVSPDPRNEASYKIDYTISQGHYSLRFNLCNFTTIAERCPEGDDYANVVSPDGQCHHLTGATRQGIGLEYLDFSNHTSGLVVSHSSADADPCFIDEGFGPMQF